MELIWKSSTLHSTWNSAVNYGKNNLPRNGDLDFVLLYWVCLKIHWRRLSLWETEESAGSVMWFLIKLLVTITHEGQIPDWAVLCLLWPWSCFTSQVGRFEVNLISPDSKSVVLEKNFKDISSCSQVRLTAFDFHYTESHPFGLCYDPDTKLRRCDLIIFWSHSPSLDPVLQLQSLLLFFYKFFCMNVLSTLTF